MNSELNQLLEYLNFCGVPLLKDNKSSQTLTLTERVEWLAQNYAKCRQYAVNNMYGGTKLPEAVVTDAETDKQKHISDAVKQAFGIPTKTFELSTCQKSAWTKLQSWLERDDPYFVLRGYAGTGKTYLMQLLLTLTKYQYLFTAPTNKATGVLAATLGRPAKTLYAQLGLRMSQDEEGLVLSYPDPDKLPYMRQGSILVVDEAGMVGKELLKFVEETRKRCGLRVLYVGDPMQLPPVNEKSSKAWSVTDDPKCRALLKTVMRFDNQILTLSAALRQCIKDKNWISPIQDDNANGQGVRLFQNQQQFIRSLTKDITPETFINRKLVAWRNKTVERYNEIIRQEFGFLQAFCVKDRLLIASPVEKYGQIVAHIDEEGVVTDVVDDQIRLKDYDNPIDVHAITLKLDTQTLALKICKEEHEHRLQSILSKKAAQARRSDKNSRRQLWEEFWNIKNQFHSVRYAYALTAHRIQGSTYNDVYIDQQDILANPEKREAFRCLYVGSTRPTTRLSSY